MRSSARWRVRLKTSLNSLISPRAMRLQLPHEPPGHADRIGDVAEDELDRREAGVELAVQLLPVGAGGELDRLAARRGPAVDGGRDGEELAVAVEGAQLVGDAGDPDAAVVIAPRVTIRSKASMRPSWMMLVICVTSPPTSPRPIAARAPAKPIENTLLPITSSPGE